MSPDSRYSPNAHRSSFPQVRAVAPARPRLPLTLDTPPIKCAIITPCFAVGGTETWINSLIESTDPAVRWCEVCILDKSIAYGDVSRLLRNGTEVTFGVDRARQLTSQLDVVVIWGTLSHTFWTSQSRARLVSVAHGDGSSSFTRSIMQGNAGADLHVACSAAAEPCLPKGRKAVTICNAVDLERLRARAERGSVRQSLGIASDARLLGFIGRAAWEKNAADAVNILAALEGDWHLLLAGPGHEMTGWSGTASRLGVLDRIHPIGIREDVGDILRDIDALLVTSTQEGFGYVIAEAWSVGTPVYSTRVGAAAIWPEATIELPNAFPESILGADQQVMRIATNRGPFHAAAEIVRSTFGTNAQHAAVAAGRQIVEQHLSLSNFGQAWSREIANLVGINLDI